ncbi:MAG: hypothetical protein SGBAC_005317 [Bacillariaceae sp.]
MSFPVENESSLSTIIVDVAPIDSMESPPSDRMIKTDLLEKVDSPIGVQDFMDDMISDDGSTSSYDMGINFSEKSEDSHHSLQAMISNSLIQIEGVMGEILNETSSSSNLRRRLMKRNSSRDTMTSDDGVIPPPISLRTCSTMGSADMNLDELQEELTNADKEEKQQFKQTVMANVERISSELEETRKNEEALKQRIENLREKLAKRRELRSRIVNARKVVEAGVNSLPKNPQDETKRERQERRASSEELKPTELNEPGSPTTRGNLSPTPRRKRSWTFFFMARRRDQQEEEKRERDQEQSMSCRDADELISSIRTSSEKENSSIEEQQRRHQENVKVGRRKRFQARSSWGSFIPAS